MKNTSSCHIPPCKHSLNWSRRWFFFRIVTPPRRSWNKFERIWWRRRSTLLWRNHKKAWQLWRTRKTLLCDTLRVCVIHFVSWSVTSVIRYVLWRVMRWSSCSKKLYWQQSDLKVKTCAMNGCLTSIPQTFNSWKEVLWTIILLITLFKTILTYIYLCSRSLMSKKYISYIF